MRDLAALERVQLAAQLLQLAQGGARRGRVPGLRREQG
jgi:hypothetical protein